MRRSLIIWSVIFGVFVAAFIGTVIALNATLFSAGGFVRVYLDSVARGDVQGALALPGVEVPEGVSDELLDPDALAELSDIRQIDDVDLGDGTHQVTVEYAVGPSAGRSTFLVQDAGSVFGLFSGWRFTESPLATIEPTVLHENRFSANGVPLRTDSALPVAVFTPGWYVFDHESAFLAAEATAVAATTPGEHLATTIDVQADTAFVEQVQEELTSYLEDCATQRVLMPSGCPFGQQIDNRIESEPVWSLTAHPQVTIMPGAERGTWQMPPTGGVAHLTVDVRSIFDGTRSTFDGDVPFTVQYLITFQPDGSLLITAQ
ncbi:hypothetical protein [Salinibacterium sp. ZJ454]|uniref:hypothetical protein n=1 Tax=Salinibacterium sp. ZJ454 TaxID=2708339 RepID=UPI001420B622|nr:hypothetical protein [Salinibacterium sp. ZJ454]